MDRGEETAFAVAALDHAFYLSVCLSLTLLIVGTWDVDEYLRYLVEVGVFFYGGVWW